MDDISNRNVCFRRGESADPNQLAPHDLLNDIWMRPRMLVAKLDQGAMESHRRPSSAGGAKRGPKVKSLAVSGGRRDLLASH